MLTYLLENTIRLDARPAPFGAFHLSMVALIMVICLCMILLRKWLPRGERCLRLLLATFALELLLWEVGKQLCYSYESGSWSYNWERFPFQFCSTPIYVALVAMWLPDCKLRRALLAFLATYSPLAGASVLLYPAPSVFHEILFLDLHTMLWHGEMLIFGLYLWLSGAVQPRKETVLAGAAVYLPLPFVALGLNELSYAIGFAKPFDFNMFYIGRLGNCTVPILSWIQDHTPYAVFFLSYVIALGMGGALITLAARSIQMLTARRRG